MPQFLLFCLTRQTFAVYLLAEYPHVPECLHQEIFSTVGSSGRSSPVVLRNMRYLLNDCFLLCHSTRGRLKFRSCWFTAIQGRHRTPNKPIIWPSLKGGKPFYIPADTKCEWADSVVPTRYPMSVILYRLPHPPGYRTQSVESGEYLARRQSSVPSVRPPTTETFGVTASSGQS